MTIIDKVWCTPRQTFDITPISDITYNVGDSAITQIFTPFSTQEYCSDIIYFYSMTQSSGDAYPSCITLTQSDNSVILSV